MDWILWNFKIFRPLGWLDGKKWGAKTNTKPKYSLKRRYRNIANGSDYWRK